MLYIDWGRLVLVNRIAVASHHMLVPGAKVQIVCSYDDRLEINCKSICRKALVANEVAIWNKDIWKSKAPAKSLLRSPHCLCQPPFNPRQINQLVSGIAFPNSCFFIISPSPVSGVSCSGLARNLSGKWSRKTIKRNWKLGSNFSALIKKNP